MGVSRESELLDQIENLEGGYEDLKFRCKKQLRDQRAEFLEDLDFLERNGNADWNIRTKLRPKWEERNK